MSTPRELVDAYANSPAEPWESGDEIIVQQAPKAFAALRAVLDLLDTNERAVYGTYTHVTTHAIKAVIAKAFTGEPEDRVSQLESARTANSALTWPRWAGRQACHCPNRSRKLRSSSTPLGTRPTVPDHRQVGKHRRQRVAPAVARSTRRTKHNTKAT